MVGKIALGPAFVGIVAGTFIVSATARVSQSDSPHALAAQTDSAAVRIYRRDQEIALALSAAPKYLRDNAGVYALEPTGYVKVRDSHNGFTCIVNRDGPHNEKPTCYDAVGTQSILPVDVRTGELLLKGTPIKEIRAEIVKGFRTEKYHVANRPGVAYMLSNHNQDYDPQTGQTLIFPPHVMFYAPYLTNKDIGSKGDFSYGMPSIGYQGPMGFIIVPCGAYCGKPLSQSM